MQNRLLTAAFVATSLLVGACGSVDANDDDGQDLVDAGNDDIDADIDIDAALQVAEAPLDNDSLANPAESHFLSITGERNFNYVNEVSHPGGDTTDFIEFEFPNNSNPNQVVRITLDCTITGQVDAQGGLTIFEDGQTSASQVLCNQGEQILTVDNTKVQVAEIGFTTVADASHMDYTLTVVGFQ